MPISKKRVSIDGSERKPVPGAQPVGPADPKVRADVTLRLRPRKSAARVLRDALKMAEQLPQDRKYLTREEFAAKAGADPADLKLIDDFARDNNLTIVDTNVAARTVRLNGTVADLNNAFGVKLQEFQVDNAKYRGRTGKVSVPESIATIIEAVYGLDNRRVAKPHYRVRDAARPTPPPGTASAPAPAGTQPQSAGQ